MVHYAQPIQCGTQAVASLGDGYTINIKWYQAYPDLFTNKIAYHIYFATVRENIFSEGVKFVVIDGATEANIIDLTPGQDYFFCVRPVEYNPDIFDLTTLPIAHDNIRFYPNSLLRRDMTSTDLVVPLIDIEGFPSTGVIKIGIELIQYLAVDSVNRNLVIPSGTGPIPGHLVLQSNNQYYLPASTNTGSGTINSLTLSGSTAPNETWIIRCVFVERDGSNNPIPGTAKFEAIGSISGSKVDSYGNTFVWDVYGTLLSNGILSFSISETSPTFKEGDYFTIQVAGSIPGTTGGRGFNGTPVTSHTVYGYDGTNTWSPLVGIFTFVETNLWDRIFVCQSRFEYPNFPFTIVDGYRQETKDLLSTDLTVADETNINFPMYDYSGYHRTDPVLLFSGACVGSYIGGEQGCIDGYGNYNLTRGFSLQDRNTQQQDILLSLTARLAVLIRRQQTGITCSCYLSSSEYQDDRCPFCYGTKFVFGYEQYFDPRRSDGRIQIRVGPTPENLKMYEAGLESEFPLDAWTLTVPTIKTRDVIVLFDQANNEEFRYEVMDVIRNNTLFGLEGAQHFKLSRIRKYDPAYQIRIFRDTSDFPSKLNTSLSFTTGIPPHSHEIVISEKIISVGQINQTTAVSQGHNHPIVNGQVMEVLGHTHQIILP